MNREGEPMWPRSVLLVSPDHFRIEYAINPFMLEPNGRLRKVDKYRAKIQWNTLKALYQELGLAMEILESDPEHPDMVFCANQMLPIIEPSGSKSVVLGRMNSPERQGEVKHFRHWAESQGLTIYQVTDFAFEGAGDAIWNFETMELFGGYGFRSDVRVYDFIEKLIQRPIQRLELCDPNFYHLDTCFAILNGDTAVYVEEAFDRDGLRTLTNSFKNLIRIGREEAISTLAANCFSPNGKDVLINAGAKDLSQKLRRLGFIIHEVDTSEFNKAGGSVFCLKQALF
jgi:N-dimethylarginine dimethylaminohydrolase